MTLTDAELLFQMWKKESGKNDWQVLFDMSEYYGVPFEILQRQIRFAPYELPFTGSEIEKELGVTRQNVSQILKRALNKVYLYVKKSDPTMSPFEIANYMAMMFKIEKSEVELVKFFNLFPPVLRNLIKESAMEQCRTEDQERIKDANRQKEVQAMQELP